MTGIQEVALPMDFKLRNIEETEAAKKRLLSAAGASTARYHNISCKFFVHGLNQVYYTVVDERVELCVEDAKPDIVVCASKDLCG